MGKKLDWSIGATIGIYEILEDLGKVQDEHGTIAQRYKCRCRCGNEVNLRKTSLITFKSTKNKYGCNRCANKVDNLTGSISVLIGRYRSSASQRGLLFSLSRKEFTEIIQRNCYYCGQAPKERLVRRYNSWTTKGKPACTYTITCHGIDRIDSSKGYEIDNCVSCCTFCNRCKNDSSLEEFEQWILNAADYIKQKYSRKSVPVKKE